MRLSFCLETGTERVGVGVGFGLGVGVDVLALSIMAFTFDFGFSCEQMEDYALYMCNTHICIAMVLK